MTYSPTSCAVSTGSDRRQHRHERRHPVPSRRRRQDRCARIAGKNAIPRHQRRQLFLNHPDRREDGRQSNANCTSSGFESHSTGWEGSIWGIPVETAWVYVMRTPILSIFLAFALCLEAEANSCKLSDFDIELTPELLDTFRFSPSDTIFQFLQFGDLSVSFKPPTKRILSSRAPRKDRTNEVIPIELSLVAWVLSPRDYFLEKIREKLPPPKAGDRIDIVGGVFMDYVSSTRLRINASVRYMARMSGISLGESYTPVGLTIDLEREGNGNDIRLEVNVEVGKSTGHSSLGGFVNLALLPLTVALEVLGQPTLEERISDQIGRMADDETSKMKKDIEGLVRHFNVDSLDEELRKMLWTFGDLFDRRLLYTDESYFLGTNISEITDYGATLLTSDAHVALRLSKASRDGTWSSFLSKQEACEFHNALSVVESMSDKIRREEGRKKKRPILEELWDMRVRQNEYEHYRMNELRFQFRHHLE